MVGAQEIENQSVFILMCDASPEKVIVLDTSGRWISKAREIEIKLGGGGMAAVKCVMYEGAYKPRNPLVKTWKLGQISTVSENRFQEMIDNLQNDPEAVKKLINVQETPRQGISEKIPSITPEDQEKQIGKIETGDRTPTRLDVLNKDPKEFHPLGDIKRPR